MADTIEKVYSCPDNNCAEIMAMMNNNNNNWMNNPFMYLIWLAFFGNNGFGWGNRTNTAETTAENYNSRAIAALQDTVNTNHNNDLAMLAIQGNGQALHELAGNLNVGVTTLSGAVNSILNAILNVGATNGLGQERIINSVILGNKDLVQLIASCCCENKQLVTTMGYEGLLRDAANTAAIQSRIDQLSNGILSGFSSTAFETLAQTSAINFNLQNLTQALKDTANTNTDAILAKLNQMTSDAQQDKINSLTAQLTAANARAERLSELLPIIQELNSIKSALPSTVAVQYPLLTAYPSYLNAAAYNSIYGSSNSGFWN